MRCKNRFLNILVYSLSLILALQGPGMAQVVLSLSQPIIISVRVTTHPDDYNTNLPLQMASPVVSDLDNDCILDIVGTGYNPTTQRSTVYVWHRNGRVRVGWPQEVDARIINPPAVGDLDGDGDLEITANVIKNPPETGGWVYIWHHDGSLFAGFPFELTYTPGSPVVGDVRDGFEEDILYQPDSVRMAVCDIDLDGKKEIILASSAGIGIYEVVDGNLAIIPGLSVDPGAVSAGTPIAGDADGDGLPEIFLAVQRADGNYIYGWRNNMSAIEGFPLNIAGVENTQGGFLALADINGDGSSELITGSTNGWIAGWYLDTRVAFSQRPIDDAAIYQPIIGDIDNDSDMEILASSNRAIYCYDHNGNPVDGWPRRFDYDISQGAVLVDIDSDSSGDALNPVGDLELLYSAGDGRIHVLELPGNYNPNNIQWGMYGFNNRNTGNYLRDWDTAGWSVFDSNPAGARIESIYDWNRGARVIELRGAGLDNSYAFRRSDGRAFDSKNTALQWSMQYNLPFNIYVSVDTLLGRRYLYYSATDGNGLLDASGRYIHHGLGGSADNGMWHTFRRDLVTDLKDAEPANEIVDVNAVYAQGSGRIDDVMLLPGLPAVDLVNLAFDAEVTVSSGDETKGSINDGDSDTSWVSDTEDNSSVRYAWDTPQTVNKVVIENVSGATGGRIIIRDIDGNEYVIEFTLPIDGGPLEVIFDAIDDVVSIEVEFNNVDSPVTVGEIGVYNDPNAVREVPEEEEYSADSYIRIRDGYFFNPVTNSPWIPNGIAYQTWNAALGQWQTHADLHRDLDMMAEIGVDAIRVDFVWRHIETTDGVYDWPRYDSLLEEAQARGIKVFPLIGYQWPPAWFEEEWYTMHPQNERHRDGPWQSDIISYEDPEARAQFRDFLQAVVSRYSVGGGREDLGDTVAGWILGNEYGYLGLWSLEYDGYDPDCQDAFRGWLSNRYMGDIDALNARWAQDNIRTPGYLPNYPYSDFDEVDMPIPFGYEGDTRGRYLARDKASWYDLTEWREESIAGFIALAAEAVKSADPDHLITYSAVGMQWGEEDWRYHTEDSRKIAQTCSDRGTPLDFWSINNYPWGLENTELVTGQWGIEKARHDTGLPVMITETGFTNTETIYPGIDEERQARLVRNVIWESLESGAIGVCIFHWNDRSHRGLSQRERGFGLVKEDRTPKPAYASVRDTFRQMDEIDIAQYLVGSRGPIPDIAFLWDDATDTIINRYKAEMKELFGTLERLGYEPTFINDQELLEEVYRNYDVIVLPRNQKMFDLTFDLLDDIRTNGVKLHADSDIPGIMNEYGEPRDRDDWLFAISDLFGIDASGVEIDPDLEDGVDISGYETSSFVLRYMPRRLSYPGIGFNSVVNMWKYRDVISADMGTVIARFDGEDGPPALVFNNSTAISLFSMGDSNVSTWTWSDRYDWMKTIYMDPGGFDMAPVLNVSNKNILVDYRSGDDFVLLSFKNYNPASAETVEVSTAMIAGRTVVDLLTSEIIEDSSDGTIIRSLEPEGHGLVLAYDEPDFRLSTPSATAAVDQGGTTSYRVDVAGIGGFSSDVSFSVSGLPADTTNSFTPDPVRPDGSTVLNISTALTTPAGSHTLTISGTGAGITHSLTVTLNVDEVVVPRVEPDFRLSTPFVTASVDQGGTTSYRVDVAGINGFSSDVSFSVSGLPADTTNSFTPDPVRPDGSTVLNISTALTTPAGSHTLTISGTGAGITHSLTVTLNVNVNDTRDGGTNQEQNQTEDEKDSQRQQNQTEDEKDSQRQQNQTNNNTATTSNGTTTTSSGNEDDAEEDDDSSTGFPGFNGPATVIIYEEDKNNTRTAGRAVVTAKSKIYARQPSKRTYLGSEYHGGSTATTPGPVYPEIPPLEQFQRTIEEAVDREIGTVRVEPKLVLPGRAEDVIKRPTVIQGKPQVKKAVSMPNPVGDMNNWISRLKDWWHGMLKKIQLAYKVVSHRYV